MKGSIITIAALLVTMVAMTGIAAATGIDVTPDPIDVSTGATGTQTVTVSAPGDVNSLAITGEGFDLTTTFTVKIDGVETTSVTGPWTQPKTFTVTFTNNKGASNANYIINYKTTYNSGTFTKTATVQADVIGIPEFPAIAAPIAAVIGLVFFFQHRKKKEE